MDRNRARAAFEEELGCILTELPESFENEDFQKLFIIALDHIAPEIWRAIDEDTLFEIFLDAFENF